MANLTSSSSSNTAATAAAAGAAAGAYPAALELVRPLQPLLAGFAHRNKNQHRGARWFASFAMLRRHVDKLADETAARAAARPPQKKKKKKKQQQQQRSPAQDDDDDNDDDGPAPRRARWLRDVLVPKCYLAFSQLAADNQFATLGVVLLGALAQVQRACVCLVGEGAESTTVETTADGGAATTTTTSVPSPASARVLTTPAATAATTTTTMTTMTTNKSRGAGAGVGEAVDVGEAVSRDALVGAAAAAADRPPKKRKKPAGSTPLDAGGAGPGDPPARDCKEADVKPAKKKKKAKKGDEFDDLFNSLF